MPKVPVDNLKAGMKLSRPVVNDNGMILLGEGTEITEAAIERLRNMNILSVSVEGGPQPEKSKEEMLSELDMRFRKTEHEPHMGTLKRLLKEHIEESYK